MLRSDLSLAPYLICSHHPRKMGNKKGSSSYPKPFVVGPRKNHKHSLILLHGRGGNGEKFGTDFLASETMLNSSEAATRSDAATKSDAAVFASMLPNVKFIFPTASKRRAKWYNRATISQWFDSVPIDEQDAGMSKEEEEWQIDGLRQSRAFLKSIVDEEVDLVGAPNVFIGGLSQGCAMGLHLLLSYEESPPLGGFVGMSGWLPYADAIETIICSDDSHEARRDKDDEDDPFATSEDEGLDFEDERTEQREIVISTPSKALQVCNFVRDNMDLPLVSSSSQPSWLSTPVFLGHGKRDEKVKATKGLRASNSLKDLGVQVTWNEYDEGHWYKVPEETDEIVVFLQACLSRQRD